MSQFLFAFNNRMKLCNITFGLVVNTVYNFKIQQTYAAYRKYNVTFISNLYVRVYNILVVFKLFH